MPTGLKIERGLYDQVKKKLRWHGIFTTAVFYGLSAAKVSKIGASKDFEQFKEITRAEHPPEGSNTLGRQFTRLLHILTREKKITGEDALWIKTGKRDGTTGN